MVNAAHIVEQLGQSAMLKGLEKGREEGMEKGREEGMEKGLEKGLRPLAHQFARKLGRARSDDERAVLLSRLDTVGADRLGDAALDLSSAELAACLADPAAR